MSENIDCPKLWAKYKKFKERLIKLDSQLKNGATVSDLLPKFKQLSEEVDDFEEDNFYKIKFFIQEIESISKQIIKEHKTGIKKLDFYKLRHNDLLNSFNPGGIERHLDQRGVEKFAKMFFNLDFIKKIFQQDTANIKRHEYFLANKIFSQFLNSNSSKAKERLIDLSFLDQLKPNYFLPDLIGGNYQIDWVEKHGFESTRVDKLEIDEVKGEYVLANVQRGFIRVRKNFDYFLASDQKGGFIIVDNSYGSLCSNFKKGGISIIKKAKETCLAVMQKSIALIYETDPDYKGLICDSINKGIFIGISPEIISRMGNILISDNATLKGNPTLLFNTFDDPSETIKYRKLTMRPGAHSLQLDFPYFYFNHQAWQYYSSHDPYQPLQPDNPEQKQIIADKKIIILKPDEESAQEAFPYDFKYQALHKDYRDKVFIYQTVPQGLVLYNQGNVIILENIEALQKNDQTTIEKMRNIKITAKKDDKNQPSNPDLVLLRVPDPQNSNLTTFEVLHPVC
jgi:hypothetical protein